MDNKTSPSPIESARALIKQLQAQHPVFRDALPLAIGIDKQILARQPDVDRKTLRVALGLHTHSTRYLKTLEKATHRIDLDGAAGDEISEEHRKHAAEMLRERYRKEAEVRKARKQAEIAAAAEEARARKLDQLVAKFSKSR